MRFVRRVFYGAHPQACFPAGNLGPRFLRVFFVAGFVVFCGRGAAAQGQYKQGDVVDSTVPAVPGYVPAQSNLMLNLSKTADYSRLGLDYSVKWDFSDMTSFRPGLKLLSSGVKSISSWDITKNTRLNYYGFKTNPWRVILADEKPARVHAAAGPAAPAGGGVVSRAAPASRKRFRLSVTPLLDDFKLNLEDNLRDMLLRGSLENLSPQWEKAGKDGRREFVRDILSLGIWDVPLPGVKESRGGLEYLSGGAPAGAGVKVHKSSGAFAP